MKNKLLLLAVVVIVGALLYYCFNTGSKSEDVSAAAGETYKLEYTPTLQAYGFTEPVILKAKPQRVVSLVHTPVLALYEMGIKQVSQQPIKTSKATNKLGKRIPGRDYIYSGGKVIRNHTAGHQEFGMGAHFNAVISNIKTHIFYWTGRK